MKVYNAISLETGMIRAKVQAGSYEDAVEKVSNKFNCYALDDYIIELASETEAHRAAQSRWWNLQTL